MAPFSCVWLLWLRLCFQLYFACSDVLCLAQFPLTGTILLCLDPFFSVLLGSAWFCSALFSSVQLGSIQLRSAHVAPFAYVLHSALFSALFCWFCWALLWPPSALYGSVLLCSALFVSIWLRLTSYSSVWLRSAPFGSVGLCSA